MYTDCFFFSVPTDGSTCVNTPVAGESASVILGLKGKGHRWGEGEKNLKNEAK